MVRGVNNQVELAFKKYLLNLYAKQYKEQFNNTKFKDMKTKIDSKTFRNILKKDQRNRTENDVNILIEILKSIPFFKSKKLLNDY